MYLRGVPASLNAKARVTVLLFGQRIAGEVIKVGEGEAVIEFSPAPEIFEVIEAFEDFMHHDEAGGFSDCKSTVFADVTPAAGELDGVPSVDDRGCLTPQNSLDGLGMLFSLQANRPLMVRSEKPVSKVRLHAGDQVIELRALPVALNGYLLQPPADLAQIASAIAKLQKDVDTTHPPEDDAAVDDARNDDLPVLGADGSVTFRSFAQFLFQVEANLSKAAVMAKGTADALGARQALKLVVPGHDPIDIPTAEVLFQDSGRVGFSVHHPNELRTALQQALLKVGGPSLHGRPAPTPAPVLRVPATAKPKPLASVSHRVALRTGLPSPSVLIDFARSSVGPRPTAGGWYVGVLDWALRLGQDLQLTVTNDADFLRLWLHRGHIVGAIRRPVPGSDRLGQRLVSKRIINGDVLRDALKTALKTKEPIGQVVIQTGKVAPAQVHRTIRYQFLDRLEGIHEWTSGWIEVGEMSPLPAKSDLVAISRTTAIAHLLRRQLAKSRLPELREATRLYLNQPVKVDLSHLLPSYRLNEREQQFFARCAQSEGSLAATISRSRVRPIEAYRMLLLGTALGFVTLTEPLALPGLS